MANLHWMIGGMAAVLLAATQAQAQTAPRMTTRDGQPSIYSVESGDPAMDAANERARATLSVFNGYLPRAARGQVVAQLKARFAAGDVGEHMWVTNLRLVDGKYHGILDNEPTAVRLSRGDTVVVDPADVSDWMVVDDGQLIGGFTLVELRRRMTRKQREQMDRETYFRMPADSAVWNIRQD